MPETTLTLLYIPCPTKDEAEELATALLRQRLIACANITAATSMYAWPAAAGPKAGGASAINKDDEWIVLAKTVPAKSEKAKELVLSIHSYELPCILEFTVSTTSAYHGWVSEQIS